MQTNTDKFDILIKMMEERPESSTIYVPTEANIPILEATRRMGGMGCDSEL
jgi:hypothetical protein